MLALMPQDVKSLSVCIRFLSFAIVVVVATFGCAFFIRNLALLILNIYEKWSTMTVIK